jgi:hypothetical protein
MGWVAQTHQAEKWKKGKTGHLGHAGAAHVGRAGALHAVKASGRGARRAWRGRCELRARGHASCAALPLLLRGGRKRACTANTHINLTHIQQAFKRTSLHT